MDRRALAQRHRKPHAATTKNQNSTQHNETRQNPNSPVGSGSNLKDQNGSGKTLPTGNCTVCRKIAVCVCQRCADYYCSPDCQLKDWPSHRYICFPMPALAYPNATLTTDDVYLAVKPLMIVNSTRHPNMFNQMQQLPPNLQHQNTFSMNGPQPSTQKQQQQQQQNKPLQQNANQVQKYKEPTGTVPTAEVPKPGSCVILTGLRTPNRAYIRDTKSSDDYALNARKIDSYGKSAPPLGKMPKVNSYVIAPYDGIMCRVQIQMIRNPDNIRVIFIDRGIVASRRLRELREINNEIISLKQHSCLVPLRHVSNYVLNEKLTKRFATYEDLEFKIKYDQIDDGVELFYWQNEKSLNEEIEGFCKDSGAEVWTDTARAKFENVKKKGLQGGDNKSAVGVNAQKTEQQNVTGKDVNGDNECDENFYAIDTSVRNTSANSPASVKQQQQKLQPKENNIIKEKNDEVVKKQEEQEGPTMIAPFEMHYFKVGCSPFQAIVVDVSCLGIGYIGCVAKNDLACLQKVHKQLSSIEVSDKPYEPKVGEYCIAKFEDMWYRAQVIDAPDKSHYNVMYIDFTNEATLTSAEIRHYPADVTEVCKTNLCLIDGLPSDFSEKLIEILNNEIQLQTEITIDGVKVIEDQVVVIECKSLLDNIGKHNLLT